MVSEDKATRQVSEAQKSSPDQVEWSLSWGRKNIHSRLLDHRPKTTMRASQIPFIAAYTETGTRKIDPVSEQIKHTDGVRKEHVLKQSTYLLILNDCS